MNPSRTPGIAVAVNWDEGQRVLTDESGIGDVVDSPVTIDRRNHRRRAVLRAVPDLDVVEAEVS